MDKKLWTGRFEKSLDKRADDFNSSIHIDSRMFREDILGSVAHVKMLGKCGIITSEDSDKIENTLHNIMDDIISGKLMIDYSCEDIHSFIEKELTERIGDTGKKLHTARSRNDQVALDMRMAFSGECDKIAGLLKALLNEIIELAAKNINTVMPGYTHLQRAQPVTYGYLLCCYGFMFLRDLERINTCIEHTKKSPLGAAALAGSTYPVDREYTAGLLGFNGVIPNAMDAVSDRDYQVEILSAVSLIMMHLSRFSEEIILHCSYEFKFITLDDGFSTGSSIMPQKKNPDIAELVRGKSGRAYGNLISLLTILKGLPLAYNKDLQEDKELVFDSLDTVKRCLEVFAPMLSTIKVNKENMRRAAETGYINATDLADYLVSKGYPFRDAYKIVGEAVAYAEKQGKTLSGLSMDEYKKISSEIEEDVYKAINIENCVEKRNSQGGTSSAEVLKQISLLKKSI